MTIEQKAIELYPVKIEQYDVAYLTEPVSYDANEKERAAFLAGANYALELAAERALVRVQGSGRDYTDDEYVNDWDWGQETVTVDKQSILELKAQSK